MTMTSSELDDLTLSDGILFHTAKGRPCEMPVPLAPLADTHGHLTVFSEHDPAMAIARAALAGVRLLVVPVDPTEDANDPDAFLSDLMRWRERAAERLDVFAAAGVVPPSFGEIDRGFSLPDAVFTIAGVHPYGAAGFDAPALERLEALLDQEGCLGVGEIGLDYTCDVDRATQERVFREQLRIASRRGLPVELHIRDERDDDGHAAHADALRILSGEGVPAAGCDLHCFTDDVEVMRSFVEMGCRIAFGGAATFKKSDDIRDAATSCPSDLILSETDCPYMAPVPLRGQECEPAMVAFSAACLADVREDVGVARREETYRALWENALSLYRLG